MEKIILTAALVSLLFGYTPAGNITPKQLNLVNKQINTNSFSFIENNGQVVDQNYQPRADVLFSGHSKDLTFYLRNSGISYQLYRVDSWKEEEDVKTNEKRKMVNQQTIYRIDINWLNANTNTLVKKDNAFDGVTNFYTEGCPKGGALNVKSYNELTYQNLYTGIDLKWYQKNGELKYDYLCAAGADYKQIQLQLKGSEELSINAKGELVIKTPLGTIIENAPLVLQSGRKLKSSWLLNGKIVSFEIENLNKNLPYIIDPLVRSWGTYFGANGDDRGYSCTTDASSNIYVAGYTGSTSSTLIATTGSHQTSYGGGNYDGLLAKFNSAGFKIWSTYYGGNGDDYGYSCTTDASGNVFLAGYTQSNTGTVIATVGSHQPNFTASTGDAFLVKLNASGVRQWGTYYGGNGDDYGYSCTTDASGNVYLAGLTSSNTSTLIATVGSHQPTKGGSGNDAFLTKFNAAGVRLWGTFYGGTSGDSGRDCTVDASGDVYLSGESQSTGTLIATSGCHQSNNGGGATDAFLAKFNSSGVRQWATFYGGSGNDYGRSCSSDASGNVYVAGETNSTGTVIATAGGHQASLGGSFDGYLVKFNSAGVRQWGSFYGSSATEYVQDCSTDGLGNVYLAGLTQANTGTVIATSGIHQSTYGGGTWDGFLIQFNASGVRQWGTYYGGVGVDQAYACTTDAAGNFYLTGYTGSNTTNSIATYGSSQPFFGGAFDVFLVKFTNCPTVPANPINTTPIANQTICAGTNATLSATSGTDIVNWFPSSVSNILVGTGTTVITPTLSAGSYTFYAEASGCTLSALRTAITVSVKPTPTVIVNSGAICSGNSFTITPSGANTYTIQGGNAIISPSINTSYTVVGTNTAGCTSQNLAISNITVNANPTITATSGTICNGSSFTIISGGANTYTIQGGSAIVSPTTNSTYTVIGTSTAGCISQGFATSSVTVSSNPTITINSGTICSGNSFTLTPNGANTYTIQGGNAIVSPSISTTYTVTGANSAGCISQNFATSGITVNPNPTITAVSNASLICVGQTATLTASGAATYSWNTTATSAAIAVSPTITTTFTVNGIDANGCGNEATITQAVSACTGLDNLSSSTQHLAFQVYPNPSNGNFEIVINEDAELIITNVMGQIIKEQRLIAGKNNINLNSCANGVYFLLTTTETKSSYNKLIKE